MVFAVAWAEIKVETVQSPQKRIRVYAHRFLSSLGFFYPLYTVRFSRRSTSIVSHSKPTRLMRSSMIDLLVASIYLQRIPRLDCCRTLLLSWSIPKPIRWNDTFARQLSGYATKNQSFDKFHGLLQDSQIRLIIAAVSSCASQFDPRSCQRCYANNW